MNIVIAGCQHETNTFSPIQTTFEDFAQADSWPKLLIGKEILDIDQEANIPIAGFIKGIKKCNHELIPILWCSATPSGIVTNDAADKITQTILDGLIDLKKPIDGIYLDLHGAMVTERHDDYEGFLLESIRKIVGVHIPIVVSLDLHANVTELMVENATALIAYQTYPHVDASQTGENCADLLNTILNKKTVLKKHFKKLPFLIPMTAQCTLTDPAKSLYQQLENLDISSASICMGFPLSDTSFTAPSIMTYDESEERTHIAATTLYKYFCEKEHEFQLDLLKPEAAVSLALQLNQTQKQPVILADTQDNPGCGGSCDTTGLLHALVNAKAPSATIVMMTNHALAQKAHDRGTGKNITAHFSDSQNAPPKPITLDCKILALGDGDMIGTGPFYKNCEISLGPVACLEYNGIKIIVSSKKMQAADQVILHHLGIDPTKEKIIILKSSVHFRADFSSISDHIYVVESPGLNIADLKKLPYKKISADIRY